jgi:hypothetical protein
VLGEFIIVSAVSVATNEGIEAHIIDQPTDALRSFFLGHRIQRPVTSNKRK